MKEYLLNEKTGILTIEGISSDDIVVRAEEIEIEGGFQLVGTRQDGTKFTATLSAEDYFEGKEFVIDYPIAKEELEKDMLAKQNNLEMLKSLIEVNQEERDIEKNILVNTLSSREVAGMLDIKHKDLLKKIENINQIFDGEKIRHEIYWQEGTFENRGKKYKCYNITKKGCEFLSHKMTGTKGVIFTHRYMERFEAMEQELKGIYNNPQQIQRLIQREVSRLIESKNLELKQELKDFKENAPLFNIECEEISNAVKRKGVQVLGGKNTKSYKNRVLRSKVYMDIYGALKWKFNVSSYKAIKRKHFLEALELIEAYDVDKDILELIESVRAMEV